MTTIGVALAEQYDRAWEMLRASILRFTAEEWRSGDAPSLVPARWALHAVEAVDFYHRPTPDGFPWGERFGVRQQDEASRLPAQEPLVAYLDDVQRSLGAALRAMPDSDLLSEANPFAWTGETVLQRYLYALRHLMTHQGELAMLLRLHGAAEAEWR